MRRARPDVYGRAPTDRLYDASRRRDAVLAEVVRLRSSSRWRSVRLAKLRRDPLCELCLAQGFTVLARDVNHTTPVRVLVERGTIEEAFRLEALQSLCRSCHNKTTARESAERRAARG